MEVRIEYQEWLERYAKAHGLSLEDAVNELIGDALLEDHDAQNSEFNRDAFTRVIRGSLNQLSITQLRLILSLIEEWTTAEHN